MNDTRMVRLLVSTGLTVLALSSSFGCLDEEPSLAVQEEAVWSSSGSGSGSGSAQGCCPTCTTGANGAYCAGGTYCGKQDTKGLSCPVRNDCGDYYQKGVHCWAMYRNLGGDLGWFGKQHHFTGCITTGAVATPHPYNTMGAVYEDNWATEGFSSGCWDNTISQRKLGYAESPWQCPDQQGNPGSASVGTDLGCTTVNLGDAERYTHESWARLTCDRAPAERDEQGHLDPDTGKGYKYPAFPHTYEAPAYGLFWGHGKKNCNCVEWSKAFRGYVASH